MNEKLIIFDCDGVLVDSEFICSKVFSKALATYGYNISTEECIRRFTGMDEDNCRVSLMEETGIHIPKDYWVSEQTNLQKAFNVELTALIEPVLKTLDSMEIPRCVASNSKRNHVVHCLEVTKQLRYFTDASIFTSQQVKKAKPAPDLFLFAAKEMGFEPKDCLVIEDSLTGANAAIAAGMDVLMFLGGSHARFDWYKQKVACNNKPTHLTAHELEEAIRSAIFSTL